MGRNYKYIQKPTNYPNIEQSKSPKNKMEKLTKETTFKYLNNPLNAIPQEDQISRENQFSHSNQSVQKTDFSNSQNFNTVESNFRSFIKSILEHNELTISNENVVDLIENVIKNKVSVAIEKITEISRKRLDQLKDYPNAIKITNDPLMEFNKMLEEERIEFEMSEDLKRRKNINILINKKGLSVTDKNNETTDKIVHELVNKQQSLKKKRKRSLAPPTVPNNEIDNQNNKAKLESEQNIANDKNLDNKFSQSNPFHSNNKNPEKSEKSEKLFVGKKFNKHEKTHIFPDPKRHSNRKFELKDCVHFFELEKDKNHFVGDLLIKAYNKIY